MTQKEQRRRKAHLKKLKARALAQAHNQSAWASVVYQHGQKDFADHGSYYPKQQKSEDTDDECNI